MVMMMIIIITIIIIIIIYQKRWLKHCKGRLNNDLSVGVRFSAHVQTGTGDIPSSCTMGNEFLSKGHGVDHPAPSGAEVKERVKLYLYSRSGRSWPVLG